MGLCGPPVLRQEDVGSAGGKTISCRAPEEPAGLSTEAGRRHAQLAHGAAGSNVETRGAGGKQQLKQCEPSTGPPGRDAALRWWPPTFSCAAASSHEISDHNLVYGRDDAAVMSAYVSAGFEPVIQKATEQDKSEHHSRDN